MLVRKNSGSNAGDAYRLNLIEGDGISLTVAGDNAFGEVDITIANSDSQTFLGASNGTDDSPAIQAALDSGNKVIGAFGETYRIGATLTPSGTADYAIDFNGATLVLNDGVNDAILSVTTTGKLSLKGGTFDGNSANNGSFAEDTGLIQVDGPTYASIDVDISDAPQDGLVVTGLTGGSVTARVDTCGASAIVVIDSNYVDVSGQATDAGSCGVLIKPVTQDCVGVNVTGAKVDTTATIVTSGIGVYFNSGDSFVVRDSAITDCHVVNAGYVGIFPGGDRNTVKGCTVNGAGVVTAASAHAYWIHDSAHISLIGCLARASKRGGFTVGKAHNVTLDGCIAVENENHGFWTPRDDTATGRYQGTATNKDVTFVGCHAVNNGTATANTYDGFFNDGYVTVTYDGCQAHDYQVTQTQRRGLEAKTNASTSGMKVVNCDWTSNKQSDGMSVAVGYLDHAFGNVGTTSYKLPASMRQGGKLVPTAAIRENFNRLLASSDLTVLTSGTLRMQLIWLEAGDVVSSVTFVSAATAATSPTHQWFALYSSARALLGQTSDDTTTAWAADTAKTLSLTAAYTVPTSGYYYIGAMVAATTPPHLRGIASNADVTGLAPVASGNTSDSSLTDTAPSTAAAPGPSGNVAYCYVG